MKTFTALVLMLFIAFPVFADYAVQKKDGSVTIVNGEVSDLGQALKDHGLDGLPVIKVSPKDLPPAEDRKYWIFNPIPMGQKLIVDQSSKKFDTDAQVVQENKKTEILNKLGLTEEDFQTIVKSAVESLKNG